MDVHRCRFVDYTPSAINALAFSHTSGKASRDQPLRLAIGRANGDIEIWDPKRGAWIHEITLYGGQGRSVDGLAWVQDPDEADDTGFVTRGKLRLFSIGYSSTVTEWDLITGLPLRQSGGNHSEVWCLAAQPVWHKPDSKNKHKAATDPGDYRGQNLVAGCADGSLVLLSTADDGLTFKKIISRAGKKTARALSITFQSRNIVVVGYADSSVRVHDIRNGKLLRNISVGSATRGGPKETLIWAVECLKDGTIVAGDSNGEISFWDATNYGQLQRIKAHQADILCLASSADGQTVLSSGIDRRTCLYRTVDAGDSQRRWAKITHRRIHRHDVKAMACFESSKMSVVVSGGLDAAPVLFPLRDFETEYHRQLPFAPQNSPITGAQRLVASWHGNEVTLWHVGGREVAMESVDAANFKLMAKMALKGEENITSASLSSSGKVLAVSTVAQTSLFHLQPSTTDGEKSISISKLKTPAHLGQHGARLTHFSPDSRWLLVVRCDGSVQLSRIVEDGEPEPSVLPAAIPLPRTERPNEKRLQNWLNGYWGSYDRTIVKAAFSSDGRVCAASDLGGRIDTWLLEGHEDPTAPPVDHDLPTHGQTNGAVSSDSDSEDGLDEERHAIVIYGQHWIRNLSGAVLPRLSSSPLILSFRPSSPSANPTRNDLPKHIPNGNPAVHPTRHNPHAHSHTLPSYPICEDRLLILTAAHELFEFHAITGRLTEWSRANPSALLPARFKLQRDRATSALWDAARERVWIYAATWLAMLDLRFGLRTLAPAVTTDLVPAAGSSNSNANGAVGAPHKRRRSSAVATAASARAAIQAKAKLLAKRAANGVAGSAVRADELGASVAARKIRKLAADGTAEIINGTVRSRRGVNDSDDDEEDDDDEEAIFGEDEDGVDAGVLTAQRSWQRRQSSAEAVQPNGSNGLAHVPQDKAEDQDDDDSDEEGSMPFYLTTRYRQILGLVALQPDEHEDGADDDQRGIEVALIERPFAALDLGPRFEGGHEWER